MKRFFVASAIFAISLFGGGAAWAACGINIDPANPRGFPTPQSIRGAGWVRMEFKDCTSSNDPSDPSYKLDASIALYKGIIDGYKSVGVNTVLIIDYMSYPSATADPDGFGIRAGLIAQGLGSSGIVYQIWNEPDIWQGGNLSPQEYSVLLNNAATQIKAASGAQVLTAGFASGRASYLNGVNLSNVDAVAIHPYGKVPNGSGTGNTGPLSPLISDYYASGGGKSLWITEIGLDTADQGVQAQYLRDFYNHVNGDGRIANTLWFAWSDGMVSPFGIVTAGNTRKQSHSAFFNTGCGGTAPSSVENLPAISVQADPGVSCSTGGSYGREKVPRTIIGRIVSSETITDEKGATKTQFPVENATICVYQGAQTGSDGIGETIVNFETMGVTNKDGYFAVDSWLRYDNPEGMDTGQSYGGNNYIGILCGNDIHEVFQVDMDSLQRTALSQKYWIGMKDVIKNKISTRAEAQSPKYPEDYLWQLNNEILTPIELALRCDPNPSTPSFNGTGWKAAAKHFTGTGGNISACPAELIYTDRSGNTTGDCEGGKLLAIPRGTMEQTGSFKLTQPQDSSKNGSLLAFLADLFNRGGRDKPPAKYEGLLDTRGLYKNAEEKSNIMGFLYGGMGAAVQGGTFWPVKDSPDPDVVSCEYYRQGNQMINLNANSSEPYLNAQSVAGFVNMLRPPVDTNNPQSLENFYLRMDKLISICTTEDGTLIQLYQIKPPTLWESYYSRMNNQDRADFCTTNNLSTEECDERVPRYTTCTPGEEGCRYLLGTEYFPYSIVAKNMGGSAGEEYYQTNLSQGDNQSYGPADASLRRTMFFDPNETSTYQVENGQHIRAANEPATPAHGWDFSGASIVNLTTPEMIVEAVPSEGIGDPGLMVLSPVTGLTSGVSEVKESLHKSIKGFDHCIISVLDGHRVWPITRSTLMQEPTTYQAGQSAANFNIGTCTPTEDGSDCSGDSANNALSFYKIPDIRGLLKAAIARFFDLFSRFPEYDTSTGTCVDEGDENSCVEGSDGCVCTSVCPDLIPTGCGDPDWTCCTQRCVISGPDEYDCNGNVDPAEVELLAKTEYQDLSKSIETVNGIAAMILPPGVLEKGEFGTRENLCTTDMLVNLSNSYSSENSIGIESPCSKYTSVIEAARQAVTPHNTSKL